MQVSRYKFSLAGWNPDGNLRGIISSTKSTLTAGENVESGKKWLVKTTLQHVFQYFFADFIVTTKTVLSR